MLSRAQTRESDSWPPWYLIYLSISGSKILRVKYAILINWPKIKIIICPDIYVNFGIYDFFIFLPYLRRNC